MSKWIAVALAGLIATGAWGQAVKQETKAERDKRMEWWREARLGMFIHWGLYAVPAGQWNGKTGYGEWIREEAHIPVDEYEKFQPQFNPVNFDADAWVRMARDAGMKYITITTKHHDGFALFDSKLTDWDIMGTPFKRDIMAEMATACRKYGVKMCWYHSIMDWHHPDYLPRRGWEAASRPANGADFDRYVTYLRNQVTELLTNYGDIGVMWFDGEWESTWNNTYGKPLYDLCRTLQPNVIVNNRVGVDRGGMAGDGGPQQVGDFSTPEQYIPATGLPGVNWETCMTMNEHWGYNSHDANWKSSPQLIRNIVDIASKGGNYLLNVGPRADGTFPPESAQRLKDIGAWMRVNGDGIYGTSASVFDTLPWGRSTTRRDGNKTTLFLHVFEWPKDGRLIVPGIGNQPLGATLMGGGKLKVNRTASDIILTVPKAAPNATCTTIALAVSGAPIIYRAPKISAPANILVDKLTFAVDPGSKELTTRYTLDGGDPNDRSPLYRGPITVQRSATLKVASFHNGRRVSPVASMSVTKVEPIRAQPIGGLLAGLHTAAYKGDWDRVPDFSTLKPLRTGTAQRIELEPSKKPEEQIAHLYSGFINVPSDGVYSFALTSDDGSKLWVDGKVVVDNDGLHSSETKTGQIALAKGPHIIAVGWFNKTGGAALHLEWAKAGGKYEPVDAKFLWHLGAEGNR
jgi:alpha-L-fucosidase